MVSSILKSTEPISILELPTAWLAVNRLDAKRFLWLSKLHPDGILNFEIGQVDIEVISYMFDELELARGTFPFVSIKLCSAGISKSIVVYTFDKVVDAFEEAIGGLGASVDWKILDFNTSAWTAEIKLSTMQERSDSSKSRQRCQTQLMP